jgi:fucose 4-O-acetylase-like acetyltransferase
VSSTLPDHEVDRSGSGAAARVAPRDAYWDHVRLLAIALVVVGHSIEKLDGSGAMYALYLFIYAFHMPLFALVSGVFAKAEPLTRRDGGRVVTRLLVPYVVFSVIWAVIVWRVEGRFSLDLGAPYWHLWFLFALAVWRLLLPVFAALRFPVAAAVAVGVASGFMPSIGTRFDMSRTLGMLPFFVLGWAVQQRGGWRALRAAADRWPVRAAAVVVLGSVAAACLLGVDAARAGRLRAWFQLEQNYADLGADGWLPGVERLVLTGLSVLLCLAVLVLVRSSSDRLGRWGQATMYVYLLHVFPIYALRQTGWFGTWFDSIPRFLLLVVAALALTAVLSTRAVTTAFRPLVEPPWANRLLGRDLTAR